MKDVLGYEGKRVIVSGAASGMGAATAGLLGIPTIGLGPGDESFAHAVNERVPVAEVAAETSSRPSEPDTASWPS